MRTLCGLFVAVLLLAGGCGEDPKACTSDCPDCPEDCGGKNCCVACGKPPPPPKHFCDDEPKLPPQPVGLAAKQEFFTKKKKNIKINTNIYLYL